MKRVILFFAVFFVSTFILSAAEEEKASQPPVLLQSASSSSSSSQAYPKLPEISASELDAFSPPRYSESEKTTQERRVRTINEHKAYIKALAPYDPSADSQKFKNWKEMINFYEHARVPCHHPYRKEFVLALEEFMRRNDPRKETVQRVLLERLRLERLTGRGGYYRSGFNVWYLPLVAKVIAEGFRSCLERESPATIKGNIFNWDNRQSINCMIHRDCFTFKVRLKCVYEQTGNDPLRMDKAL